jgi:hypothetical protein
MSEPIRLRPRRAGPELPRTPKAYTREARGFWEGVVREWDLDVSALALLDNACRALMRVREAQKILAREGVVIKDRYGQSRPHPAAMIEQTAMATMLRHIRALDLTSTPSAVSSAGRRGRDLAASSWSPTMPTVRRRRPPNYRPALSPGLLHILRDGTIPDLPEPEIAWWWACNDPSRWWREYGDELVEAWVLDAPGSRPWGWWRCEAPEARQVIAGAERLRPGESPDAWQWHWKQYLGVPASLPGAMPFVVESEASYLHRVGLLEPEEKAMVTAEQLEPEVIDEGDTAA